MHNSTRHQSPLGGIFLPVDALAALQGCGLPLERLCAVRGVGIANDPFGQRFQLCQKASAQCACFYLTCGKFFCIITLSEIFDKSGRISHG